jgi:hypothetical protein
LWGTLTLEEAHEISDMNSRRLAEGTPPVHIVVDVTQLERFPTSVRLNTNVTQYLRSPNLGWVVAVGDMGPLLNFAFSIIGQVARFNYARRDSLQAALQYLQQQDVTLAMQV